MTTTCFAEHSVDTTAIVATFGAASLIQRPEGGYSLTGGSFDDRATAKEWISLFMHEAVMGDN